MADCIPSPEVEGVNWLTVNGSYLSLLVEVHFFNQLFHCDWLCLSASLNHLNPKGMMVSIVEFLFVNDHEDQSFPQICTFQCLKQSFTKGFLALVSRIGVLSNWVFVMIQIFMQELHSVTHGIESNRHEVILNKLWFLIAHVINSSAGHSDPIVLLPQINLQNSLHERVMEAEFLSQSRHELFVRGNLDEKLLPQEMDLPQHVVSSC